MTEESLMPDVMQTRIEYLREDACVLFAIAKEPHMTPVHPPGVIDRDELPSSRRAGEEEVESVVAEFDDDDEEPRYGGYDKAEELEHAEIDPDRELRDDTDDIDNDDEPRYPGWSEEQKQKELENAENEAAQQSMAIQQLLDNPELARFYTDLLIHSPTTVTAARDRQGFSENTAYKHANTLAELEVAEELNEHEDGSNLWRADSVSGHWTTETSFEFGPVLIAVYGATGVDDDLALFVDRYGKDALTRAVTGTVEYLMGNTTRRGVARKLDIPAAARIAVTQATEGIIAIVESHDPMLDDATFEIDVHERALAESPYR